MRNVLLILFMISVNVIGAKVYVDRTLGDDSNDGSISTPFANPPGSDSATGNAASYSFSSGDSIILRGGETFYGLIRLTQSNVAYIGDIWPVGDTAIFEAIGASGDTALTCFDLARTADTTLIQGVIAKHHKVCFVDASEASGADGVDYLTVRYFRTEWINRDEDYTRVATFRMNNASYSSIDSGVCYESGSDNVNYAGVSHDNTITGCEFYNGHDDGVTIGGGGTNIVQDCFIYDLYALSPSEHPDGIVIGGPTDTVIARRNIILNITQKIFISPASGGAYVKAVFIFGNLLGNTAVGASGDQGKPLGVCYRMQYDTIHILKIIGNTFTGCNYSGGAIFQPGDEGNDGDSIYILNNIFHNSISNVGTSGAVVFDNTVYDNNLFDNDWDSATCVYNMSLIEYQASSSLQQNSVYGDMLLTTYTLDGDSVTAYDFHLNEGSAAIGIGTYPTALCDYGACVDKEGTSIANPPDAGAYAYTEGGEPPATKKACRAKVRLQ